MMYRRTNDSEEELKVSFKDSGGKIKPSIIAVGVIVLLVLIAVVCVIVVVAVGDPGNIGDPVAQDYYDASISPLKYFRSDDAALLDWYQSANSENKLNEALKEGSNFITVDVSHKWQGIQKMFNQETQDIMVGEPTDEYKNMTFASWLDNVLNQTVQIPVIQFYTTKEAQDGIELLHQKRNQINQPMFVHADILKGPNTHRQPIDTEIFLKDINDKINLTTLSLGWTDEFGPDTYTWDQLLQMKTVIDNITQPVTVRARVSLLVDSSDLFWWLVEQFPKKTTITLWHPEEENETIGKGVYLDEMVKMRNGMSVEYIYYNLPQDMYKEFIHYALIAGHPVNHFRIKSRDALEVKWTRIEKNYTRDDVQAVIEAKRKQMMFTTHIRMTETEDILININGSNTISSSQSDDGITLDSFIKEMSEVNCGLKINLLNDQEIEPTLHVLNNNTGVLKQPSWLHANVFNVSNSLGTPMDVNLLTKYIDAIFPHVTISLGWTPPIPGSEELYELSEQMILDMLILTTSINQPINIQISVFAILDAWLWVEEYLLNNTSNWLTIWADKGDNVDMSHLLFVRQQEALYKSRIFYDLPKTVMAEFQQKVKAQTK